MTVDRREFVVGLGSSVAATTLHAAPRQAFLTDQRDRRTNVVIMICDDLGFGDLGCYGSRIKTPNLDRLASQGVRLTNFNAGHPICSASRAALMTGRYAGRSGTEGAYFPKETGGMSLAETTLGDLFHRKNYRTMCIGKWHLGHTDEYLPTRRGFDSFFGVPYSDDMSPLPLIRDTTVLEADTNRELLTPRYTEHAVQFINQASAPTSTEPFFLYLAYSYPHDPARASAAFKGHSSLGVYGDCVEEIDWSVGEVMKVLDRAGVADDTIVVFTSDHGPWFQGSPGALRGRKCSTFEGGFRVPFLMRAPRRVPQAAVIDARASNFDILPTLVSWCGLDTPRLPLDGIDIITLLTGREKEINRKGIIYFTPFGNRNDVHCIRSGDWKLRIAQVDGEMYIADRTSGRSSYLLAHPELYHLAEDPEESYDVAAENPEIVQRIMADLEQQIATFPAEVIQRYEELKSIKAGSATPAGAAPPVPCMVCS